MTQRERMKRDLRDRRIELVRRVLADSEQEILEHSRAMLDIRDPALIEAYVCRYPEFCRMMAAQWSTLATYYTEGTHPAV